MFGPIPKAASYSSGNGGPHGISPRDWNAIWAITATSAVFGLFFLHVSLWIPVGFGLTGLVAGHLVLGAGSTFPLPHAAILIACIYYLFAPLMSLYYPAPDPLYSLRGDLATYFGYAVPCLIALAIGWASASRTTVGSLPDSIGKGATRRVRNGLDLLLFGGMIAAVGFSFLNVPLWARFIAILCGNVRYIGALGWIVLGSPGWKWRLAIVLIFELYLSTTSGFFLDFALWCLNAGVIFLNRYRPSRKLVLALLIGGVLFLPCIQYAKWEYRRAIWGIAGGEQSLEVFGLDAKLTTFNKPPLLIAKIVESFIHLLSFERLDEFFSDTILRYNQGWIVDRILTHVPSSEPFAGGETIRSATMASVFPRFIYRDKMKSGGAETFTRFTGVELGPNTSMNLGFVGEMYANYGYLGGIAGCGVYGLLLGFVLRFLLRKSEGRPMLLSFIPFVMNFAVVSEVGLLEVLNYTVKSAYFVTAIYFCFPALFGKRKNS